MSTHPDLQCYICYIIFIGKKRGGGRGECHSDTGRWCIMMLRMVDELGMDIVDKHGHCVGHFQVVVGPWY